MSSRDDYRALLLLAVDDIVLQQHFLYGTTQDVGQPPAPICYKQNSRASIGKVQSAICPEDINTVVECIENFNHGWGMVNSAHRWPGPIKFEVGIQIWNLAGVE